MIRMASPGGKMLDLFCFFLRGYLLSITGKKMRKKLCQSCTLGYALEALCSWNKGPPDSTSGGVSTYVGNGLFQWCYPTRKAPCHDEYIDFSKVSLANSFCNYLFPMGKHHTTVEHRKVFKKKRGMSNESNLTEISVVNQVLGITICT
jgi:hypothetical protein